MRAGIVEKPEDYRWNSIGYHVQSGNRFTCRTRYFSDSGIIGTKAFVSNTYSNFKHYFQSKNEKILKRISGLNGVYSLKRLTE